MVKAAECSSSASAIAIAIASGVTMTNGSATGGAGATCATEGGTVVKAADGLMSAAAVRDGMTMAAECSSASAIADTTTATAAGTEFRGTSTTVTAV